MARAGRQGSAQPISPAEAADLFRPVLESARGVLLAVSGGPDSMALLALAAGWTAGPPFAVATVDHGLRAGSPDEAELVARQASLHSLPHRTLRWTGAKPETGLQAAAREARYALLMDEARRLGFPLVATAHHADDQAETVLMRLAAGSGITGLAGMRALSARDGMVLARPLLAVPKARLIATCEALGVPFVRDPSNQDPRFGRTRARSALDALAGEGLTVARLARLASRAARAEEALAHATQEALIVAGFRRTDCVAQLDWRMLSTQPAEIRLRALGAALGAGNGAELAPRLERLEALMSELDAAGAQGLRLRRSLGDDIVTLQSGGRLSIAPAPPRRRGRTAGTVLD